MTEGLSDRICHSALCAGLSGDDGGHPRCVQESCSEYEACTLKIISSDYSIRLYFENPTDNKIVALKTWLRKWIE